MRKGALRGLDEDVAQVGVLNLLVAHVRLPDPVARRAAQAIAAGADELAARNPLFSGLGALLREPEARVAGTVGLHKGVTPLLAAMFALLPGR